MEAFERRDRVSEVERFYISNHYHDLVTGERDKANETCTLWLTAYPRDYAPRNLLSLRHGEIGQYDKALEHAREAVRLNADVFFSHNALASAYARSGRMEEAKSVVRQAIARGIDWPSAHVWLYQIALFQNDPPAMEKELGVLREREPRRAYNLQATTASMKGRIKDALASAEQAFAAGRAAGLKDPLAIDLLDRAEVLAWVGMMPEAREALARALKISDSREVLSRAGAVVAAMGQISQAEAMIAKAASLFPSTHTLAHRVFRVWLPYARAAGIPARRAGEGHRSAALGSRVGVLGRSASLPPRCRAAAARGGGRGNRGVPEDPRLAADCYRERVHSARPPRTRSSLGARGRCGQGTTGVPGLLCALEGRRSGRADPH